PPLPGRDARRSDPGFPRPRRRDRVRPQPRHAARPLFLLRSHRPAPRQSSTLRRRLLGRAVRGDRLPIYQPVELLRPRRPAPGPPDRSRRLTQPASGTLRLQPAGAVFGEVFTGRNGVVSLAGPLVVDPTVTRKPPPPGHPLADHSVVLRARLGGVPGSKV